MRSISILALLILAFTASAAEGDIQEGDVTLEGYAFGLSYHTNRTVPWNERNYGYGLGLAYAFAGADVMLSSGTYLDSYDERAKFILLGSRGYGGDRNGLHFTIGWSAGFYRGSGFNDFGVLPVLSVGYKRVDLCVTGSFHTAKDREAADGDPHHVSTSFVCFFLKTTLWKF